MTPIGQLATRSRTSRTPSAVLCQENFAACSCPAAISLMRTSGFCTSCSAASMPSTSSSFTKIAASPATSASDPFRVVITGQPHDIASSTGKPNPSYVLGCKSATAPL